MKQPLPQWALVDTISNTRSFTCGQAPGQLYAGESLETLRRGVCVRTVGLADGASRCIT
eukprot:COSAG03_NODE_7653_length_888_cov_0.987326_1_plen_58_part_10